MPFTSSCTSSSSIKQKPPGLYPPPGQAAAGGKAGHNHSTAHLNLLSALPGKGLLFSSSSLAAASGAGPGEAVARAEACHSQAASGSSSSSRSRSIQSMQAGQQSSSSSSGSGNDGASNSNNSSSSNIPALMTERKAVRLVLAGLVDALCYMHSSNLMPSTVTPSQLWVPSSGTTQLLPLLLSMLQPEDAVTAGYGAFATAEELQYMAPEVLALLLDHQQQQQQQQQGKDGGDQDSRPVSRRQLPSEDAAAQDAVEMVAPEKVRQTCIHSAFWVNVWSRQIHVAPLQAAAQGVRTLLAPLDS